MAVWKVTNLWLLSLQQPTRGRRVGRDDEITCVFVAFYVLRMLLTAAEVYFLAQSDMKR